MAYALLKQAAHQRGIVVGVVQDGLGQVARGGLAEIDPAGLRPLDGQLDGVLVALVMEGVGDGKEIVDRVHLRAAELGGLQPRVELGRGGVDR